MGYTCTCDFKSETPFGRASPRNEIDLSMSLAVCVVAGGLAALHRELALQRQASDMGVSENWGP